MMGGQIEAILTILQCDGAVMPCTWRKIFGCTFHSRVLRDDCCNMAPTIVYYLILIYFSFTILIL